MLDYPSPFVERDFMEQGFSGIVIDQGSGFLTDESVANPPHLGERGLYDRVQVIRGGTSDLVLAFPQLPPFAQEGPMSRGW